MNGHASLGRWNDGTAAGSPPARAAPARLVAAKYHSSRRTTLQGADVQDGTWGAQTLHVDSGPWLERRAMPTASVPLPTRPTALRLRGGGVPPGI